MRSILDTDKNTCFICAHYGPTELHHVFNGADRKHSDADGLTVYLCHTCHQRIHNGIDGSAEMFALKQWAEKKALEHYGWTEEDFRKRYRKSYLYERNDND